MKKIIKFLIILSFTSFIFAENCGYLSSSNSCLQNTSILKGGFYIQTLIFQPKQEGLNYVINNSSSSRFLDGIVVNPKLDWTCGARAGMNYIFDYDHWNLNLNGSFLITDDKDRQHQNVVDQTVLHQPFNGQGLIPVWSHPRSYANHERNVRYSDARAKWDLSFYNINLLLGKKYCISKKINFHPFFGLNNIFIYQKYTLQYENGKLFPISLTDTLRPNYSKSINNQDTYGIGPKVGVDTKWYYYRFMSFFANISGSLLYNYLYVKRHDNNKYTINTSETFDNLKMKNNITSLKPLVELALGINFEKCFERANNTPFLFKFNIGYEALFFWKLNHFIQFADDVNDGLTFSSKGDFQMHGMNIGLNFMF